MTAHTVTLCAVASLLLAGCGSSAHGKVDVTVTMDGAHHLCNVALSKEAQASSISCGDVAPFLHDELRVPSGAVYELRGDQKVDPAELRSVSANLNKAGYRSAE